MATVIFTLTPTVDTYEISDFTVQYWFSHIYLYNFVAGLRAAGTQN